MAATAPPRRLTPDELHRYLVELVKIHPRGQRGWAEDNNVSFRWVNMVLRGHRELSPGLAEIMGFRRVALYEPLGTSNLPIERGRAARVPKLLPSRPGRAHQNTCKHGHLLTAENTAMRDNGTKAPYAVCKTCRKLSDIRSRERREAAQKRDQLICA